MHTFFLKAEYSKIKEQNFQKSTFWFQIQVIGSTYYSCEWASSYCRLLVCMRYFEIDILIITRDKVRLLNFLSLKGFDVELKKISELSISSSSKINVFKANKYMYDSQKVRWFSPREKSVVPFFSSSITFKSNNYSLSNKDSCVCVCVCLCELRGRSK